MTIFVTGTVTAQEGIYLEGAPYLMIQDATASPLRNPDANGFYWNLSGTSTYPVYQVGCIQDVSLTEDVTMNMVRCDTEGDKDVVQKRNYVDYVITIASLFPLSVLAPLLNISLPVTSGSGYEKAGIGKINNNQFWHVFAPKIYDDTTGDYLIFHLHRAKFVDAWTINMKAGDPWTVTGLKARAFYDDTKPAAQAFGCIIRYDPSVIV